MDAPTTRSAVRQQQLEEQVATILGLMQDQGRSSAEQAQLSERRQITAIAGTTSAVDGRSMRVAGILLILHKQKYLGVYQLWKTTSQT